MFGGARKRQSGCGRGVTRCEHLLGSASGEIGETLARGTYSRTSCSRLLALGREVASGSLLHACSAAWSLSRGLLLSLDVSQSRLPGFGPMEPLVPGSESPSGLFDAASPLARMVGSPAVVSIDRTVVTAKAGGGAGPNEWAMCLAVVSAVLVAASLAGPWDCTI